MANEKDEKRKQALKVIKSIAEHKEKGLVFVVYYVKGKRRCNSCCTGIEESLTSTTKLFREEIRSRCTKLGKNTRLQG